MEVTHEACMTLRWQWEPRPLSRAGAPEGYTVCKDKWGKKSICLWRDGEQSPRVEEMKSEPRETKAGRIQRGQKKTNTPNWSEYSQAFGDNWKHLKSDLAKLRMKMDTHTHPSHPTTPKKERQTNNERSNARKGIKERHLFKPHIPSPSNGSGKERNDKCGKS